MAGAWRCSLALFFALYATSSAPAFGGRLLSGFGFRSGFGPFGSPSWYGSYASHGGCTGCTGAYAASYAGCYGSRVSYSNCYGCYGSYAIPSGSYYPSYPYGVSYSYAPTPGSWGSSCCGGSTYAIGTPVASIASTPAVLPSPSITYVPAAPMAAPPMPPVSQSPSVPPPPPPPTTDEPPLLPAKTIPKPVSTPKAENKDWKRAPIITETRSMGASYDIARNDNVRVGFWNLTDMDVSVVINGRPFDIGRDQQVTLDLGRQFEWRVGQRAVQMVRVPDGSGRYEVLIRP